MKIKSTAMAAIAFSVFATVSSQAVVLAQWTFETSVPVTAGPHAAEQGVFVATSSAIGATDGTWSNPAGWGSIESFSSNGWDVGDYFEFTTSTVGYAGISVNWQQTGSNTGPAEFELTYSINGTSFFPAGSYTVTNDGWNTSTTPAASEKGFDLSSIVALDEQAQVIFRLVSVSTLAVNSANPVAAGGTSRVDNFTVTAVPEPSTALLGGLGMLALLRRRR